MPNLNDIRIDTLNTRIAKDYKNATLIGRQLAPTMNVDEETGQYYVYGKEGFRIEKDYRTGLSRANRVSWDLSLANYGPLTEHSLEIAIEWDFKKKVGEPVARRRATNRVVSSIELNHEKLVADTFRSTSIITQNVTLAGATQWSHASGVPVDNVVTALAVMDATGLNKENTKVKLFIGRQGWNALRVNAQLRSMLSTGVNKLPLSKEMVASLLDIDEVVVGEAQYDTAKEGQTPSLSYIWGKDAILARVSETVSPDTINPAYTLEMPEERYVDGWEEKAIKADMLRANAKFAMFLMAVECAYLFKDAVA